MGFYNVVNASSLVSGMPEDISQVLANFNAIATVLNGGVDNTNINAAAAIDQTKLALPIMGRSLGLTWSVTPPASPSNGDLWLYPIQVPYYGAWLFYYQAGAGDVYKWNFIGGPPITAEVQAQESRNGTTYGDTATPGPTVTVPFVGVYDFEFSAMVVLQTSDGYIYIGPQIGATSPSDTDAALLYNKFGYNDFMGRTIRRPVASTNTAVKLVMRASNMNNNVWSNRCLAVRPVRVSS